ncbi:MAG: hypothetical protein A3G75_04605 [Verrucomicrobia bacterium RIFCSPLOWO2_12_FULL_64_8]|nr:MAG: hypothetical protein A3G75_04605 [Verrucomicrobia bacterium RIFCSPLOWO2_12_FULL_64_8]
MNTKLLLLTSLAASGLIAGSTALAAGGGNGYGARGAGRGNCVYGTPAECPFGGTGPGRQIRSGNQGVTNPNRTPKQDGTGGAQQNPNRQPKKDGTGGPNKPANPDCPQDGSGPGPRK